MESDKISAQTEALEYQESFRFEAIEICLKATEVLSSVNVNSKFLFFTKNNATSNHLLRAPRKSLC